MPPAGVLADIDPNSLGQRGQLLLLAAWERQARGELAGHGPIPASAARALAADGEWRRLVTDPSTGTLRDYGRRTYSPPAALVDFLLARDGTCRFPGRPRPAERCDLDHEVPWDEGGTTDRANMGPVCRRHHRLKTHTGCSSDATPTPARPGSARPG